MKTQTLLGARLLMMVSLTILFNGCLKDKCTHTYTYFQPVYKTTAEVRANIKSSTPKQIEQPGKIALLGNYIFLNEINKGVHIIDNSNPADPKNVAFINIPGNVDLAIKGNILYADFYTDLVAIDISDPLNAKTTKFVEGIFPNRYYGGYFTADASAVIVDWEKRDTTVDVDCANGGFFGINFDKRSDIVLMDNCPSCAYIRSSSSNSSGGTPTGITGSMARMTIIGNYLYGLSDGGLDVIGIGNPSKPVFTNKLNINWNIETIYPFKDKLFIGSSNGMYIYDVSNGADPVQLGTFQHVQSCDPVIADDNYAYVTLRSGTSCQGFTNELEVLDISNINSPSIIKTYPMTNPHGLSKDGTLLFICDGGDGLKIYKAADVHNITLLKTIDGIDTYDVIAWNHIALVAAKGGYYQYDYSDVNNIRLISKIDVQQ